MDLDQNTFEPIDNLTSAMQSVEIILSTRLGERVMLREFGGGLLELLGRLLTPRLLAAFKLSLAAAIDIWEPRFRVRRVSLKGTVDELRLGIAGVEIDVDYLPLGHQGDATVERIVSFGMFIDNGRLRIR